MIRLPVFDAIYTQAIERKDVLEYRDEKGQKKVYEPRDAANMANIITEAIYNDGRTAEGRVEFYDVLTSPDMNHLFPVSVEMIMREEIEPATPISSQLFDQYMTYQEGPQVVIGAMGAVHVEEVAEISQYPEVMFDIDGGDQVSVQIKKFGVKIGFSMEARERDGWGLQKIWLSKVSNAFARNREKTAAQMLNLRGVTVMDNKNPSESEHGTTTGRGIDGAQNGTFSHNDLMKVYVYGMTRGYFYDTVLVHPFGWEMWMVDPELKEIATSGTNVLTMKAPNGRGAITWPDPHGPLGTKTGAFGNATLGEKLGAYPYTNNLNPFGSTFNIKPPTLPGLKQIIVTPFVPISQVSNGKYMTNVIFADSSMCGVFVTKENPTTDTWEDVEKEANWLKVRERWGTALYNQGRGVAVVRNVLCDRNYTFQNMNSVQLEVLTANTALFS